MYSCYQLLLVSFLAHIPSCCSFLWNIVEGEVAAVNAMGSKVSWCQIQVNWEPNGFVGIQVMIWLSSDLRFKWFGCHLIWGSSDLVVIGFEIPMILVVNWFGIQLSWMSNDLRFKWFGCQTIWDSRELDVKWFEIQMIWLSNDLRFKWFGFLQNWKFEAQKRSFSARLPSNLTLWRSRRKLFCETSDKFNLWRSKAKLFCETSFKIETLKIKNEAFLRDFPPKLKLWSSKTKLLCETSFKNEALKLKNEAFLRDFLQTWRKSKMKLFCETSLQNWSFEAQKRSFCARLPSKMKLWRSKTKHFCETSFKNDMSTRRLASEFQYVLAIFKWMLQKYCACREKVEPRHTNSCNCQAKWSLQSNTSVAWNLQPFHGFCVGGFKHHITKREILRLPRKTHRFGASSWIRHACQRFWDPHELLRLPRIAQPVEIPALATRKPLWTSKNAPRPSVFNDFDFQIALARRRGVELNFQKCCRHAACSTSKSAPTPPVFNDFDFRIALARRRGAIFAKLNFQKCSDTASF